MPATPNFIATEKDAGVRLDVFLAEKLKISRSQTQKMIEGGQVALNGQQPQKTGPRLEADDKIKISAPKKTKISAEAQKATKLFTIKDIKIIAETADYLVVEKPTGMLTHSTNKNESDSLATLLAQKYTEIKKVKDSAPKTVAKKWGKQIPDEYNRPGIVHRLDREASGLLVVARTQPMFDHLKEQFKNRTVEKEYSVLAHGRLPKDWDTINFPITRSETNDRMAALPKTNKGYDTEEGKEAITELFVEKRFVNFALLRVVLHTGRMHQIRAHLLAYNHPVVGDPMYFTKKRPRKWDEKCGRLFLHCAKLGFTDLTGAKQIFSSPLPTPLANFLTTLT
ncbi:MAG: RluA family pseudouridine synthase [Candidatus Magasanikbacteria bacterium]